jgi:hypothetical protein
VVRQNADVVGGAPAGGRQARMRLRQNYWTLPPLMSANFHGGSYSPPRTIIRVYPYMDDIPDKLRRNLVVLSSAILAIFFLNRMQPGAAIP